MSGDRLYVTDDLCGACPSKELKTCAGGLAVKNCLALLQRDEDYYDSVADDARARGSMPDGSLVSSPVFEVRNNGVVGNGTVTASAISRQSRRVQAAYNTGGVA